MHAIPDQASTTGPASARGWEEKTRATTHSDCWGLRLLGEHCLHADFSPNPSSYLTMLWYPLDFDLLTACFLSNVYLMLIKPTAGLCVHDLSQGGAPAAGTVPPSLTSCSEQSPSTSHPPCGEKLAHDRISGVHSTPKAAHGEGSLSTTERLHGWDLNHTGRVLVSPEHPGSHRFQEPRGSSPGHSWSSQGPGLEGRPSCRTEPGMCPQGACAEWSACVVIS